MLRQICVSAKLTPAGLNNRRMIHALQSSGTIRLGSVEDQVLSTMITASPFLLLGHATFILL